MANQKFNRIKEVIEEKGMKQARIAKTLGVSANNINTICSNKSQPTVKRLFEIAAILGVSARELLTKDNPFDTKNKP